MCVQQVVERAKAEDLNRQVRYSVAFVRNREGKVITDVRIPPSLPSDQSPLCCPLHFAKLQAVWLANGYCSCALLHCTDHC